MASLAQCLGGRKLSSVELQGAMEEMDECVCALGWPSEPTLGLLRHSKLLRSLTGRRGCVQ